MEHYPPIITNQFYTSNLALYLEQTYLSNGTLSSNYYKSVLYF